MTIIIIIVIINYCYHLFRSNSYQSLIKYYFVLILCVEMNVAVEKNFFFANTHKLINHIYTYVL